MRYTLVSQSATEHRLIQTLHHIVADGWSYPLIFGDIVAHYNAATGAGPAPDPIGVTLRDHVEALAAGDPAVARATWAPVLAGSTPTLLFDDVAAVGEHRSVVRRLSAEHTTALADYARTRAVTVSTVLHAAWGVVLGRLTQRTDAVFGSTVSGRGGALADTDSIVGLLINTIPVTMSWDEQTPLGEVIEAVHRQQTEVLDATHIGLPELARMAGARELFDTLVVVENFPATPEYTASAPTALTYRGFTGTDAPHYPVALVAYLGAELTVEIKYDTAVVSHTQALRFADRVHTVLEAVTLRPDDPVGALDLRTDDEKACSAGAVRPGPARTLGDAFADVVASHPDAIAVACGEIRLSYAELDRRAAAVAAALADLGVGVESPVIVALPRSVDLVVAILAVVKAGGTYVPVDIDSPTARLAHILDDAAAVCVLTDRADRIPTSAPVLVVPEVASRRIDGPLPAAVAHPDHAAYVIYTSGSTGLPKGVAVTHRNVAALFHAASEVFEVGSSDVWTMFHSAAFDFSVWEMWGALLHGGRLLIVEQEVARDPDSFVRLLADEGVTVLNQTPSAFYPLIEADRRLRRELSLRYVIFGGEALDTSRLAPWYARHTEDAPSWSTCTASPRPVCTSRCGR